jgi:hypothetical protein
MDAIDAPAAIMEFGLDGETALLLERARDRTAHRVRLPTLRFLSFPAAKDTPSTFSATSPPLARTELPNFDQADVARVTAAA